MCTNSIHMHWTSVRVLESKDECVNNAALLNVTSEYIIYKCLLR